MSQPQTLPPPTRHPAPQAGAEERHLRSPFRLSPPSSGGHGSNPHTPPPRRWRGLDEGGSPRRCHRWRQKWNPHFRGGGGGGGAAHGGSRPVAPQRGGGGLGDPSRPSANRHPMAAGKRPVQAGSPGLSTPNKPKQGHGVTEANMASRAPAQGRHHPAVARGLFALGFTRAATMTSPRDEGQGRASAPPRGSETPGKGHGRAHSEDT